MTSFPDFVWSVGEEGSDPIVLRGGRPYRQDQFAQSGHDSRVHADLADIASLGVQIVRYGTPWRLAEPSPGRYDWTRWDEAFDACNAAGLEPIVELLHFGLPDHYAGFVEPAWIDGFGRYVEAFLERYPEPRWFTPINEPGITAAMSARFGLWNDRLASPEAHARALANVVLANLEALDRIRSDRDASWIGSEGFDIPVAVVADAVDEAARRRALGWLVWDLHFGRTPPTVVRDYLDPVPEATLARIDALAVTERLVAGLDVYPISVHAVGGPRPSWTVAELLDLAAAEIRRWHERYQHPFWVAETSNLTLSLDEQIAWLDGFAGRLATLRAEGRPARGLCWYSRGDQFDWQTGLADPSGAVTEVGLYDTERRARPVAARLSEWASDGPPAIDAR
ncbi:MAG: family 1 glycosylhydrolase [Acidimicrobiia bacterium]|nr:family 1 glycosylhydrolase [Acidimicrobiia bacterium]